MEDRTLFGYNIKESTLYLVLSLRSGMLIFMKTLNGTTITLEVELIVNFKAKMPV